MTASTQGLTAQGLAGSGTPFQQGSFAPGFPPPIGAEQYLGITQPQGFQAPFWPQQPYGIQVPGTQGPYGQPSWGQAPAQYQAPFGFQQPPAGYFPPQQAQQLIQQLVGQCLPLAQQMILPQVLATAIQHVQQQVQQQVQQLIAQLAMPQFAGQQAFWAQPAWPGQAGQAARPYSGLS